MALLKIQKDLRQYAGEEKAAILRRFFKTGPGDYGEGDIFLGVKVPDIRKVTKENRDCDLMVCRKLLDSRYHEDRLLGLLILVLKYEKGTDDARDMIFKLYVSNTSRINNWDLVDLSAPNIVGNHLFPRNRSLLYDLARSNSLWERRISILSTFYFIRRGEYEDTLKISEMLLGDKEDLIHKAVGWMIREVGNRDMALEEAFLKEHYRFMPRTMLRYAIEKFPESKRQRYLKGLI